MASREKCLIDTNILYVLGGIDKMSKEDIQRIISFLRPRVTLINPISVFEILNKDFAIDETKRIIDGLLGNGIVSGLRIPKTMDTFFDRDSKIKYPECFYKQTEPGQVAYRAIGEYLCSEIGKIYSALLCFILQFTAEIILCRAGQSYGMSNEELAKLCRRIEAFSSSIQRSLRLAIGNYLFGKTIANQKELTPKNRDEFLRAALSNLVERMLAPALKAGSIEECVAFLEENARSTDSIQSFCEKFFLEPKRFFSNISEATLDNLPADDAFGERIQESFRDEFNLFAGEDSGLSPLMKEFLWNKASGFLALETRSNNNDVVDAIIFESFCLEGELYEDITSILTMDQGFRKKMERNKSGSRYAVLGLSDLPLS